MIIFPAFFMNRMNFYVGQQSETSHDNKFNTHNYDYWANSLPDGMLPSINNFRHMKHPCTKVHKKEININRMLHESD